MKRGKFYKIWNVFDLPITSKEKLVYTYLTGCANDEDIAFPSVPTIARKCSISPETVRRAISSLEKQGYLSKQPCFMRSSGGLMRQAANRYHITPPNSSTPPPKKTDSPSAASDTPSPLTITGEINNKINTINNAKSVTQSYELDELIDRLQLYAYDDAAFVKAIEMCIRQMYFSEFITVEGQKIPSSQVRSRLKELDTDCIDHVYSQLSNYAGNITNASKYVISCLYNAPPDLAARLSSFSAAFNSKLNLI